MHYYEINKLNMFQSSNITITINLFTVTNNVLSGKILEIYEDPKSWHNLFRQHIVERIDERIFCPLFSDDKGAPNASIRIFKGMMILNSTCSYPLLNSGKSSLSFLKNSNLFTTDFFRMKGEYLYPSAS